MKKTMVALNLNCVLVVMMLLFINCELSDSSTTVIVSMQDFGKSVIINRDDTLSVRLQGNPDSGGYMWKCVNLDTNFLVFNGYTFASDSVNKKNKSGIFNFEFLTKNEGTTRLQFLYLKTWTVDYTALDSFRIDLTIR